MRVGVVGAGLVGVRTARSIQERGIEVALHHPDSRSIASNEVIDLAVRSFAKPEQVDADLVVLATESMHQVELAQHFIRRGIAVVSTADQPKALSALVDLDQLACANEVGVTIGVACSPGLSSLLVGQLAKGLVSIDSITTAQFGTGGPTCAREHHRATSSGMWEIRDGHRQWVRGGTGRSLVWFPDPVGPHDCYRAGLAEPTLLQRRYPQANRIQSFQAATRRDRATSWLPMLRPPHPEGLLGAVWAEVRGRSETGSVEHRVMAATAPQATATGLVAAEVVASYAYAEIRRIGVGSILADLAPELALSNLSRRIKLCVPSSNLDGDGSVGSVHAARKWRGAHKIGYRRPTEKQTQGIIA